MAQILNGYDVTGSILRFDEDGNIAAGGNKISEWPRPIRLAILANVARPAVARSINKWPVNWRCQPSTGNARSDDLAKIRN